MMGFAAWLFITVFAFLALPDGSSASEPVIIEVPGYAKRVMGVTGDYSNCIRPLQNVKEFYPVFRLRNQRGIFGCVLVHKKALLLLPLTLLCIRSFKRASIFGIVLNFLCYISGVIFWNSLLWRKWLASGAKQLSVSRWRDLQRGRHFFGLPSKWFPQRELSDPQRLHTLRNKTLWHDILK